MNNVTFSLNEDIRRGYIITITDSDGHWLGDVYSDKHLKRISFAFDKTVSLDKKEIDDLINLLQVLKNNLYTSY